MQYIPPCFWRIPNNNKRRRLHYLQYIPSTVRWPNGAEDAVHNISIGLRSSWPERPPYHTERNRTPFRIYFCSSLDRPKEQGRWIGDWNWINLSLNSFDKRRLPWTDPNLFMMTRDISFANSRHCCRSLPNTRRYRPYYVRRVRGPTTFPFLVTLI